MGCVNVNISNVGQMHGCMRCMSASVECNIEDINLNKLKCASVKNAGVPSEAWA